MRRPPHACPARVDLQAGGPLAATVRAEITRLRALAEGADGSLVLHDPATARAAGIDDGVLAQLAAAGEESFALRADGERLLVAGGFRGLLHGFYAVLLGLGDPASEDWSLRCPAQSIRMLDHWDNMTVHPVMGQVERGLPGAPCSTSTASCARICAEWSTTRACSPPWASTGSR